jgi:hypothetical protein
MKTYILKYNLNSTGDRFVVYETKEDMSEERWIASTDVPHHKSATWGFLDWEALKRITHRVDVLTRFEYECLLFTMYL